ncbi:MAG: aminotransferase class V-fold PLP-dependent enzyme [Clostridia bacterium]|nr:aminotransferase class V-fold PLP-dependent enzyme [Clostridia bacterium]
MDTPIRDFITEYSLKNPLRLHMPGHKGKNLTGNERADITEIDGADSLYSASGIIKKSEENASSLFGANTFYSTEGSSHAIRAMLYLALKHAKAHNIKPLILAGRNAHKSFISACALLDISVEWLYGFNDNSYLTCNISVDTIKDKLNLLSDKPLAVYITSPDYLGNITDIKGIAEFCKKSGILLLVDNAHGAYTKFLKTSLHPIDLGATACADSAHKTLPALTGAAYLHLAKDAPSDFISQAKNALSLFGSTSPSYLILQSLDLVNEYISDGYKEKLNFFTEQLDKLKETLKKAGYNLIDSEPLKIVLNAKKYGYYGYELNNLLLSNGIIPEFYDSDYVVLMFTLENSEHLESIKKVLLSIPKKPEILSRPPALRALKRALTPHEALLSPTEIISVNDAENRILADVTVSCPPAVPIATCGEIIDKRAIDLFNYYGIKTCVVVKKA